jgi:uncharacterized repeat protein (TIGR03803 family)
LIYVHGAFYGTTTIGGTACASFGCGTVFKITPSGEESVIYSFGGGRDGLHPNGGLIYADNALYGTTEGGGLPSASGQGLGTVFKVTLTGAETIMQRR